MDAEYHPRLEFIRLRRGLRSCARGRKIRKGTETGKVSGSKASGFFVTLGGSGGSSVVGEEKNCPFFPLEILFELGLLSGSVRISYRSLVGCFLASCDKRLLVVV